MTRGLSVLVCVRNRSDLMRAFLETLAPSIAGDPTVRRGGAELLIYDDMSTDDTPALLDAWRERADPTFAAGVRVIRGDTPGCFGTNMNALAERASGDTLVLLNNDMLFEPGWLGPVLRLAREHPSSIIGNRQVYPDRSGPIGATLNHGGGAFARDLTPVNLYDGMPADLVDDLLGERAQPVVSLTHIDRASPDEDAGRSGERDHRNASTARRRAAGSGAPRPRCSC